MKVYFILFDIIMENMDTQEVKKELDKLNFSCYRDFNSLPYWNPEKKEEMLENFREALRSKITEILILNIYDNVWVWPENKNKLHWEINRFIDFAEGRLKYYILKVNDEIAWVFIGCTWWSTLRANDYYMQQFLKDPEINAKVKTLKAKTSDFLKED